MDSDSEESVSEWQDREMTEDEMALIFKAASEEGEINESERYKFGLFVANQHSLYEAQARNRMNALQNTSNTRKRNRDEWDSSDKPTIDITEIIDEPEKKKPCRGEVDFENVDLLSLEKSEKKDEDEVVEIIEVKETDPVLVDVYFPELECLTYSNGIQTEFVYNKVEEMKNRGEPFDIREIIDQQQKMLKEVITAGKTAIPEEKNDDCCICTEHLVEFKENGPVEKMLPCNHLFHRDCIMKWKSGKYNPKCPICRAPIKNQETDDEISVTEAFERNEFHSEQLRQLAFGNPFKDGNYLYRFEDSPIVFCDLYEFEYQTVYEKAAVLKFCNLGEVESIQDLKNNITAKGTVISNSYGKDSGKFNTMPEKDRLEWNKHCRKLFARFIQQNEYQGSILDGLPSSSSFIVEENLDYLCESNQIKPLHRVLTNCTMVRFLLYPTTSSSTYPYCETKSTVASPLHDPYASSSSYAPHALHNPSTSTSMHRNPFLPTIFKNHKECPALIFSQTFAMDDLDYVDYENSSCYDFRCSGIVRHIYSATEYKPKIPDCLIAKYGNRLTNKRKQCRRGTSEITKIVHICQELHSKPVFFDSFVCSHSSKELELIANDALSVEWISSKLTLAKWMISEEVTNPELIKELEGGYFYNLEITLNLTTEFEFLWSFSYSPTCETKGKGVYKPRDNVERKIQRARDFMPSTIEFVNQVWETCFPNSSYDTSELDHLPRTMTNEKAKNTVISELLLGAMFGSIEMKSEDAEKYKTHGHALFNLLESRNKDLDVRKTVVKREFGILCTNVNLNY